MRAPYGFGLAQEDARTEAEALGLPGGKVLSIASAGDVPLSLVALGAGEVVAVDVDAHQLHLCELKRATVVTLAREEAIPFLGFTHASEPERARWLERVAKNLPRESAGFWQSRKDVALRGAIVAGRYERYVRMLRLLLWPIAGRHLQALTASTSLEEQRAIFSRAFDGPVLRAFFRIAFKPRLYGNRGVNAEALQHAGDGGPGLRFFEYFRDTCTLTPARENYLLQAHLLGHVVGADAVPEYLTADGFEALREHAGAVRFVHAPIGAFLDRSPRWSFDRFHLSNLPDWLPPGQFDALVDSIQRHAAKPARVVWRYLHRDPALADDAARGISIDRDLGARLRARDRFPVYGVGVAVMR